MGQTERTPAKFTHLTLNSRVDKMSSTREVGGSGAPKASINTSKRSSSRNDLDANHRGKSSVERSGSSSKSPSARSRDEQRRATKFDSKKDESKRDESKKDKAVEAAKGAEEAAKNNSTPAGKRKSGEVISPSGLTPKNKTTNTGTYF